MLKKMICMVWTFTVYSVLNTLLLQCTHAASYKLAASMLLTVFHPHPIHVTCLAHCLNRLAKQNRNEFPKAKNLGSNIKRVSGKVPFRIVDFKQKLPTTMLPLQPL
jgi:hypothetical protein